jgi:DHA2 family multidrug resistance protein
MGDAALMALKQLSQIVHRQAAVMSFGDTFFMLALFFAGLSILILFLNKPASMTVGGDAH